MTSPADVQWLDEVKWNNDGLVAAIAQDVHSGRVLMMAWMNPESLQLSVAEGRAVYWSRSRQALWRKGESSGHVQTLHDIALDCDGDALLLQVEQIGDIACHTGRQSCFYRGLQDGQWQTREAVIKDPASIYSK
ncbi:MULTISPECIES: phosphoribosyl-AMP cyclohydrolase [Spongiibacter]|uniref:phosphoribosyl-AMP cyclohydrolase n=2 Tax=Spongiibacteraceae TaxID=1706375 RepID=UPI0003B4AA30|nr:MULTISPECIES: phosphoribosyl-AMP cyclohydrolase [Spongiibacter]MAY39450.1 phosphoribosyl-AMP cyclohydrolase [Spongiibacter sp.]MBI57320.1 phosphoribosyl-AMP cyclohydrolase [Spongiibacter sp.]MBO6752209.1 phosphoribosyl-AMP cyclohydrolase [Spongiibacter sp.]|tara:strand:+ start:61892 stop:62293 length:402 start_codon:yes stop_codon:yes gene_type:complete